MSLFSSRLLRVSGLCIIQVGTIQSHRTRLLFSPNAPAFRVASFPLASISTRSPSSNPAEQVIRSPTSSVPCSFQVSAYWLVLMMRVIWVSMSSSSPMIPIRQSSCSSVSFMKLIPFLMVMDELYNPCIFKFIHATYEQGIV